MHRLAAGACLKQFSERKKQCATKRILMPSTLATCLSNYGSALLRCFRYFLKFLNKFTQVITYKDTENKKLLYAYPPDDAVGCHIREVFDYYAVWAIWAGMRCSKMDVLTFPIDKLDALKKSFAKDGWQFTEWL